ncbi:hypothetical protein DFH27DRAFT_526425 [Peziza echinospora]|nr:hypothetical protein DFH27DRAFT_526425 [Peziza echinospora]
MSGNGIPTNAPSDPALLAHLPQHEVVAVNLQFGNNGIEVLAACNDLTPPATVHHISMIWQCLVNISTAAKLVGTGEEEPQGEKPQTGPESTQGTSEQLGELTGALQALVYEFCFPKFKKTFIRWYKKMEIIGEKIRNNEFSTSQYPQGTNPTQILQLFEFLGVVDQLISTDHKPPQATFTYQLLSACMDAVSTLSQSLLANAWDCEEFVRNVEEPKVNLRRALEKCTKLHRHTEYLIRLPRSVRCRAWFEKPCHVRNCPPLDLCPIAWPRTHSALLNVVMSLSIGDEHQEFVNNMITIAAKLTCKTKLHAEAHVALHLLSTQAINASHSSFYIGVSKLSCGPCKLFFDGLNQVRGGNLSLRRTHSKWYPGWGMPSDKVLGAVLAAQELARLKEYLVDNIKREVVWFVNKIDAQNIRISDSTDPSVDGKYNTPQSWKVNKAYQLLSDLS